MKPACSKQNTRLISWLFCLLAACVLSIAGPLAAYANDPADDEVAVEVQILEEMESPDSDIPVESMQLMSVQSANPQLKAQMEKELSLEVQAGSPSYRSGLKSLMLSAYKNMSTTLSGTTLENLKIPMDAEFIATVRDLRTEILEENPEIFWTSTAESMTISYSGRSYVTRITFSDYSFTASQVQTMQKKCDAALDEIQKWVKASGVKTEAGKCKVVHDWLVRNCLYNKTALTKGGPVNYGNINPWTAYGALADPNPANKSYTGPVCQGYSYAFNWALKKLGIQTQCILETEDNGSLHMWSRAYIYPDGKSSGSRYWYNVDVTHDDPMIAGTSKDFGYSYTPFTTYFLKSDTYFKGTADKNSSNAYHKNFKASPAGSNTSYDDNTWKEYNENGEVKGGGSGGSSSGSSLSGATLTVKDQTYTGSAHTPSPKVVLNGKSLTKGTHYTVSYKNNTNAGTATVTVKGTGAYSGSAKTTFDIDKASLSRATVSGVVAKNYSGSAVKQNPTVKLGGKTLKSGTDYTLSYKNNKAAGTATMTVTGKGNYTGSISKKFTISKVNIATNANVKVSDIGNKTYSGKALKPGVSVKLNGKAFKNGTDYKVTYSKNTKAGTAKATIKGIGSCTGTVTKKFKIAPLDLKKAKISGISAKKYTGKAITQNVVVKSGGTKLKQGTDYTVAYKNNKQVGTATVVITGKGSCTGSVVKSFKIK